MQENKTEMGIKYSY